MSVRQQIKTNSNKYMQLILRFFFYFRFSGITENDMKNVNTSLIQVQAVLLHYFSADTILIGHSLESDLMAIKVRGINHF